MSMIDDQNVLQACATALAGVLIFLTIERKFETKDIVSETLSLMQETENLKNQIDENQEKLETSIDLNSDEAQSLKEEIGRDTKQLTFLKKRYGMISQQLEYEEDIAKKYRTHKNIEDGITLAIVALLSTCIVFMILMNPSWRYYFLDFFNISRSLFGVGLLFLLIRIYFSTKDLTPTLYMHRFLKNTLNRLGRT